MARLHYLLNRYDYFLNYTEGIYEISNDDYYRFYFGIGNPIRISKNVSKIYLLKNSGLYLFLGLSKKGTLMLLNGGFPTLLENQDLNYYYQLLPNYSKLLNK